ncbi:hypothetical protein [Streptomyces sp. S-9]|uniref:hypothetical protein n=1 Tax=Streptomyces sp. S-9 TaxID=2806600 RepID=UPI00193B2A6B|nr:hypothetical protein [Streptomyces sp. S-9]
MDAELAALAASGATTLVSLMVTDSWVRARALMGRFLARPGADTTVIADLDDARTRLLLTGIPADEHATSGMADERQSRLGRLVETGTLTGEDLKALEMSLRRLAAAAADPPSTVHNTVSGGIQHGPIVQAGTVTGLAFPSAPSTRQEQS